MLDVILRLPASSSPSQSASISSLRQECCSDRWGLTAASSLAQVLAQVASTQPGGCCSCFHAAGWSLRAKQVIKGVAGCSKARSRLEASPLSPDAADWAATHRTNPPRLASGSCRGIISVAKPLNDMDTSLRKDLSFASVGPPLPSLQPEGGSELPTAGRWQQLLSLQEPPGYHC